MRIPILKSWLEIIAGDTQHLRCKVCNIKLTAKKSALMKHAKCQTHQNQIGKLSSTVGEGDDPSEIGYVVVSEDGLDVTDEDDTDDDEDEPMGENVMACADNSQLKENRYV